MKKRFNFKMNHRVVVLKNPFAWPLKNIEPYLHSVSVVRIFLVVEEEKLQGQQQ